MDDGRVHKVFEIIKRREGPRSAVTIVRRVAQIIRDGLFYDITVDDACESQQKQIIYIMIGACGRGRRNGFHLIVRVGSVAIIPFTCAGADH